MESGQPAKATLKDAFKASAAPVHSITEAAAYEPQTPAPARFAEREKTDVVIIGSGYTGLSAALHLAQMAKDKGQPLSIVLLEAGKVGSAASGKSGGHVGPGFQEHDEKAVIGMFPTEDDGKKALAIANAAPALVEKIITDNKIDCDMRKGYVVLSGDKQLPIMDGSMFGIEPYPFVLGMARAARDLGVKIYEDTPVKNITEADGGVTVETSRGNIAASQMLCAGGHKMAEVVPFLKPLRSRTLELLATTIVTDPLPQQVITDMMPAANGARVPFSTDDVDVAYGIVDRQNRIIFGAKVGALKTNPKKIADKLFRLLPDLKESFKKATGKPLGYHTLVSNETLNLTVDMLPNVGRMGKDGCVRYVHALGGHGIALGAALGKAAAEDIFGAITNDTSLSKDFDLFATVKHQWFPTWKPLRTGIAYAAAETIMALEKAKSTVRRWRGKAP